MFFKKNHPQTEIEKIEFNTSEKPIYILGDDDLALFLAAKLQENEQNVILLTTKAPASGMQKLKITLKEEYNLQKNDIFLLTTSYIKQAPAAILIASKLNSFRAHLTLLPKMQNFNIPVVYFNPMSDLTEIHPLFGASFYKAYFNGYLSFNGSNLTSCGLMPEILISAKKENDKNLPVEQILALTGLKIVVHEKDAYNFWKNNASRIIGYLTTYPKQHILDILNNKDGKEKLISAVHEICRLAKYEKIKLSEDEIVRELLDTPREFYYKKSTFSKIENASFLEKLYNMLSEKARTYKCKIPELNQLIKKNYEYLLRK